MAVFTVSGSSGNNMGAFRAALQAAAAITTLYYESTTGIVFSTPFSDKVIKISNNSGFSVFIGDAWTSALTITNQIQVYNPYLDTFASAGSHAIIKTTDTLSFCIAGGTDAVVVHLSKFTNGNFVIFCTAANNTQPASYWARAYNSTIAPPEQILPTFVATRMLSDTGYYHQYNPVWKTFVNNYYRTYQLTATLRILTRAANLGTNIMYEVSANDIIVPFDHFKDGTLQTHSTCMIIVNGNI